MQPLNRLVLTVAKEETRLVGVSRAGYAPGFATNKVVLKASRVCKMVVANRGNKVR